MERFDLRLWPEHKEAGLDSSIPHIIDQAAIDSRRIYSKKSLFIALKGAHADGHDFVAAAAKAGAKYAIVKKNWPGKCSKLTLLRVDDPLKAFQNIAKAYRKTMNCKVIAVIGSFGKTMVKDLLHALLESEKCIIASPESFNSQIGVPLSLLTIRKEHELAIIEAAISQVGEMEILSDIISPDYAVLTHIGKKHLTTLGNLSTTASEMIKMLTKISPENWVLIPNDPLLTPLLELVKAKKIYWNENNPNLPYVTSPGTQKYQINFPNGDTHEGKMPFGFSYFLDLLNLSIKPAWLIGVPSSKIHEVLLEHIPEPMKTEIWQSSQGAIFINDSYCSDPQSIDLALNYFDQFPHATRKIFMFGGMRGNERNDTEYRRIGEAIEKRGLNSVILVGNSPFDTLIKTMKSVEVSRQSTYDSALDHIKLIAKNGDAILIKGDKKQSLDKLMTTVNDSISTNQCLINLAAIQSNVASIRNKMVPNTRLMIMVKAEAYGTDSLRLATFLKSCNIDIFGVSYIDEGVALRSSGIQEAIFALNSAPYEVCKVVKWDLEVGVSDRDVIEALALEAEKFEKIIKVHLHVDTGMSRLGCRPEEALTLCKIIQSFRSLKLEAIMTHFACADNPDEDTFTLRQIGVFNQTLKTIAEAGIQPPYTHACNSSAMMRFPELNYNMARIGLAIYGLYPSEATKLCLDLKLAISLTSRIVGINRCMAGETISYGRSYTVERDNQLIAVVPVGYFDGLHRNYSGKGYAIIRGKKAPMVGTICMDFMMLDVTDIPLVSIGDTVLIFGEDEYGNYLSPEELASSGNSIIHELITCLGPRIQRIFIYEEAKQTR